MVVTTHLRRPIYLLLCGLLATLPVVVQAQTQAKPDAAKAAVPSEPATTTATYGSWVLRCVQLPAQASVAATSAKSGRPGTSMCEVVQTVQVQGQQQPVAQIAIGHLPNESDFILTTLLPVNVSLPGSVRVSGNGKTGADEKGGLALAWQRCYGGSCAASGKPDAASLALWRAGTDGQLRFTDAAGNVAGIPLSWNGLEQALAALEKAK